MYYVFVNFSILCFTPSVCISLCLSVSFSVCMCVSVFVSDKCFLSPWDCVPLTIEYLTRVIHRTTTRIYKASVLAADSSDIPTSQWSSKRPHGRTRTVVNTGILTSIAYHTKRLADPPPARTSSGLDQLLMRLTFLKPIETREVSRTGQLDCADNERRGIVEPFFVLSSFKFCLFEQFTPLK